MLPKPKDTLKPEMTGTPKNPVPEFNVSEFMARFMKTHKGTLDKLAK